ncbi:protein FATTY ACID EXPORT 3, chloroplastic-like isoform X1 [Malus sylvestris]|uniref:protein FATTY ACID EXPORT 3, chloroplastic-like isoform X1 n=1 Tax=Malus sylvestris TaxID=3752 RepID=UPI0021AC96A1|nr:protein FATTY ACID EXPORT 3, chloroplastic-like isoform X1 [Malus sylvestris]XP_050144309.1 protein FATTY ACID EXPORT 3, chloroplastic-like isoform X1 [Malus sylvestris]
MSVTLQFVSLLNPDPSSCGLKKSPSRSSLRFGQLIAARGYGASPIAVPKVHSGASLSLHRRSLWTRPIVAVSASQEESQHSDIEVEDENSNAKPKSEESEEAWKQTLGSFKEQTLKMRSLSREFSKKALVIMKDTSEQLKIHADKARDLSGIANEISEHFITIAEANSPEPVREIVEAYHISTIDPNDAAQVRDFRVGIPYGLLLSVGGFLSFLVTGSISAIRFGVILGGTLLFLSVSSLTSYRKGESSPFFLTGQTAISSIIFLREVIVLAQRPSFPNILTTLVSGAVVAFYFNKIVQNRKDQKGPNFEKETES